MTDFTQLRREYHRGGLLESEMPADPFVAFSHWLTEAMSAGITEPYAMVLSTVARDGQPSGRVVLLRKSVNQGLTFFTNYHSQKGNELAHNSLAAATFYWAELERQVRFAGTISKTSSQESTDYFHHRPRGSQIAASISDQSIVVPNRQHLEELYQHLEERMEGKDVPCPDHWGGYVLKPHTIEFWQGRPNRLHDRLRYRQEKGNWILERLAP